MKRRPAHVRVNDDFECAAASRAFTARARWALVLLLIAGVAFVAPSAHADDESLCGPFEVAAATDGTGATRSEIDEAGITGSSVPGREPGSIVPLPAASEAAPAAEVDSESEALLALPKDESGAIPTDFELGPGARIRESFFSPVVCATVARIAGPPGATIEQLVTVVPDGSALVANDVYASASSEVRPVAVAVEPTEPDPYLSLQYGLAISGVRAARGLADGSGVTIALLDSAPEIAHGDLPEARIESLGDEPLEAGVHGTLMAGVISATEGNGFGIAGLAPGARVVSLPVCTPSGTAGGRCTIFQLLQGLDRAWDAQAQIFNLSLSGPPNILLERGMARLEELGAVVVAAAGNEGTDEKRYPAAYPSVVGVAATDREGRLFADGNRGPWVELSAPGVDILSTVPGNAFSFVDGTSLAAAHVTGSLAVLTSVMKDPKWARAELFKAANAGRRRAGEPAPVPSVCDVLERVSIACPIP